MAFKDLLQPASFRGIPFFIFDAELAFGRRNVVHEYPYRDIPYAEDLGRKAREVTLNAAVMVNDTFAPATTLIAAIEEDGTPGTLIHPTLGPMTVVAKGQCKHKYNNLEGGINYFTITFVEAGEQDALTSAAVDTTNIAINASANLIADSNAFFSTGYSVSGHPQFVLNSALTGIYAFYNAIRYASNFGGAGNDTSGNFSTFSADLTKFYQNIPTLVYQPEALAEAITNLNAALNAAFSQNLTGGTQVQDLLYQFGQLLSPINNNTQVGLIAANNQALLVELVQLSVIAELLLIVAQTQFVSLDEAIQTQDSVADMASTLLLELANNFDDTVYNSLQTAINAMVDNVQSQASTLASVTYINIPANVPALVVAYSQYGDASQDLALVEQNSIINPSFIPGGTQLAVLSG